MKARVEVEEHEGALASRGARRDAEGRRVGDDWREAREEEHLRRPLGGHLERRLLLRVGGDLVRAAAGVDEDEAAARAREHRAADVDPGGRDVLLAAPPASSIAARHDGGA